uniref:Coiled-coil domain-containing protein 25 n=1 Tax=Otus sunia TaxID=257818 RepID=A0A8C8AY30_9STRI
GASGGTSSCVGSKSFRTTRHQLLSPVKYAFFFFKSCRFHVDKLSSAHVYLRLHKGQTVDDIPKEVLIDCAHLVKANSIQGST